jgi:CheY-like chemotaxis protein
VSQNKPKILVVDDFAPGRELLAEYLEFSGYEVATAEDGASALEQADTFLPGAILMDLSLPGIDGWEATRRLRRGLRTRDMKIIALTAHALETEKDRALEAGCDEVITKPVLPRDLERAVRRQLGIEAPPRAKPGQE